jgi:hypothetical protein
MMKRDLKTKLGFLSCLLLVLMPIGNYAGATDDDPGASATETATVYDGFVINRSAMHKEPSSKSPLVKMVAPGERGAVLDKDGDWSLIDLGSGVQGWVATRNLKINPKQIALALPSIPPKPDEDDADGDTGDSIAVTSNPDPQTTITVLPELKPISPVRIGAYTALGLGVASLALGIVGHLEWTRAYNSAIKTRENSVAIQKFETWRAVTVVSYSLGGALAVTGAMLWLYDDGLLGNKPVDGKPQAVLLPSIGGGELIVRW